MQFLLLDVSGWIDSGELLGIEFCTQMLMNILGSFPNGGTQLITTDD